MVANPPAASMPTADKATKEMPAQNAEQKAFNNLSDSKTENRQCSMQGRTENYVSDTSAEQYLIKAKAAEAIADRLSKGDLRNAWLGIADSYRELAEHRSFCRTD